MVVSHPTSLSDLVEHERSGLHFELGDAESLAAACRRLAGDRELSLKCQTENHGAIRFYTRLGFNQTTLEGADEFGEWVELRGRPR